MAERGDAHPASGAERSHDHASPAVGLPGPRGSLHGQDRAVEPESGGHECIDVLAQPP
jgi:hypothetical protein